MEKVLAKSLRGDIPGGLVSKGPKGGTRRKKNGGHMRKTPSEKLGGKEESVK